MRQLVSAHGALLPPCSAGFGRLAARSTQGRPDPHCWRPNGGRLGVARGGCWRARYLGLLPPFYQLPPPPPLSSFFLLLSNSAVVGWLQLVSAMGFLYGRLRAALLLAGWWLLLPVVLPRGDDDHALLQLPVAAWVTMMALWLLLVMSPLDGSGPSSCSYTLLRGCSRFAWWHRVSAGTPAFVTVPSFMAVQAPL